MTRQLLLTTLETILPRSPSVKSFFLRLPPGQHFVFKAGQFISIHLQKEEKTIRKPYSIASPPYESDLLELCIKRVEGGFVSSAFFSFQEGITLPIDGPDGVFILKEPLSPRMIFIGTGTGIAPLRSMILSLFHQHYGGEITLVFGVRDENEILYGESFLRLSEVQPNFRFIPIVSRPTGWMGERGHVQDRLERWTGNPEDNSAYICGLPDMVGAVREKLKSLGFDRKQIRYEKYV